MISPSVPTAYRRRKLATLKLSPFAALVFGLLSAPAHASLDLGKIRLPSFLGGGQAGQRIDAGSIAGLALSKVLDTELPLRLDATSIYPTVAAPPGGPFAPQGGLVVTAETLAMPIAPGDYEIPVFAFSMDNNLPKPGRGTAYQFGPLQGKAAEAVSTLMWRSRFTSVNPTVVLAVVQTIQSGLTYARMSQGLQKTVDQLIPDMKDAFKGNYIETLELTYAKIGRFYPLPPLADLLVQLGPRGKMALTAMRQQNTLQQQGLDDERRAQILVSGQESGVYAPVQPEVGPWTERVPGRVYMRLKIVGGAMGVNTLQLRVLPDSAAAGSDATPPTLMALLGAKLTPQGATTAAGIVGYSMFQPAQPLGIYPVLAQR